MGEGDELSAAQGVKTDDRTSKSTDSDLDGLHIDFHVALTRATTARGRSVKRAPGEDRGNPGALEDHESMTVMGCDGSR